MKLRIRGNTLRLRLTQGEVRQLRASGEVSDAVHFGPDRALHYALVAGEVDEPRARFEGDRITVELPRASANAWADGDAVGIEHDQPLSPAGGDGEVLALLIEKDFQCLAPRSGEDDSDAFPHPGSESGASC